MDECGAKSEPCSPDLRVHAYPIHLSSSCLGMTHSSSCLFSSPARISGSSAELNANYTGLMTFIENTFADQPQKIANFWPRQFPNMSSTLTSFLGPLIKSELRKKS